MPFLSLYPVATRANGDFLLGCNASNQVKLFAESGRELLVAARTYYVRTDGSDSNTGLVNNAGGAFLTVQKACNVVSALDMSVYQVTIQIADGTYSGTVWPKSYLGAVSPIIQGNNATPANVVLTSSTDTTFQVQTGQTWNIRDLTITSTGLHGMVAKGGGSQINFQNIRFGGAQSGSGLITVSDFGFVQATGNYTIAGGAGYCWYSLNGQILSEFITITISGTPAFFKTAYALRTGCMSFYGTTMSGAATGQRYDASTNAVIDTNGGGATYIPGNTAGATFTGGQYV